MITLYGIRNCDTIKRARRWLEAQGIGYRFHDYRVNGLDNTPLQSFISELGWEALFNMRGTTWRKLGESTRNQTTDATSTAVLMIEVPAIIERLLLCTPGKPMLLGFGESSYIPFFDEVQSISCPVIELIQQLIRRPSLSPDDAGCQALMIGHPRAVGFTVERVDFGDTQDFWAWRGKGKTLAFAGHADIVPAGNVDHWINPPFRPTIRDGMLFGCDTADIEGSLAVMVAAVERFVVQRPNRQGRLAFLITSDEETSAKDSIMKMVEAPMARNRRLDYCLVDKPSSTGIVGDVVKSGRRGSLTYNLTIHGVRGHVAYPHPADNPVHRAVPIFNELVTIKWDQGNKFFPATSMQITNIQAGTGSNNVTPGELFIQFSFRFSTELTDEVTKARVHALLEKHQSCYTVNWWLSGQPFLTERDKLVDAVVNAIEHYNEIKPQLLATGGMSNGRFIIRMGAQVVKLGPVNATIHKISECVNTVDLQLLARMYQRIMEQLVA